MTRSSPGMKWVMVGETWNDLFHVHELPPFTAKGSSLLVAYPISIAQYRAGFGCPHI
jgi:hypothetical protein